MVPRRRALELPAMPLDRSGDLVLDHWEVRLEAPLAQEVPEDLVGARAASDPRLREEHDVRLRFEVQVEGQEDLIPLHDRLLAIAPLDQRPVGHEALLDPREEHPHEDLCVVRRCAFHPAHRCPRLGIRVKLSLRAILDGLLC